MIEDLLESFRDHKVILIDMSWLLYRSYYAFKDLSNQYGDPTGGYYGLAKTIQTLTTSYPASLILLVDDGEPVERKTLNESYKSNREHTVTFTDKRYYVDCLIQALSNVYRVYHPTLEADDLLFSISRLKEYNNEFIIYTADKDLFQSIDDTTKISKSLERGHFILTDSTSDDYITNFMDLEPYQIPYYRAVLGDAADNLSIIRPRFPSKVAYLFAKNYVYKSQDGQVTAQPYNTKLVPEMTDKQYENLKEIYTSNNFINNLKLMKLTKCEHIPLVPKDKNSLEVLAALSNLELNQYLEWLNNYVQEQVQHLQ